MIDILVMALTRKGNIFVNASENYGVDFEKSFSHILRGADV